MPTLTASHLLSSTDTKGVSLSKVAIAVSVKMLCSTNDEGEHRLTDVTGISTIVAICFRTTRGHSGSPDCMSHRHLGSGSKRVLLVPAIVRSDVGAVVFVNGFLSVRHPEIPIVRSTCLSVTQRVVSTTEDAHMVQNGISSTAVKQNYQGSRNGSAVRHLSPKAIATCPITTSRW